MAQFDPEIFDESDPRNLVPREDDTRNLFAEFFVNEVLQGFQSREAGRKIFKDQIMVRVRVRGNDKMELVKVAGPDEIRKFPREYKAFMEGRPQLQSGTSLSELGLGPSDMAHLESIHIRTVEDLAELGDHLIGNVGFGGLTLRKKAQDYLLANSVGAVDSLKQENEELKARLEALEAAVHKKGRNEEDEEEEIPTVRPRKKRVRRRASGE